jgi:alpha-glucosidase
MSILCCRLDAPLARTPTLVRSGGIFVLGGACTRNIYDGVAERTALIFPAPTGDSRGKFTLIEDDGMSNAHTGQGVYTELLLSFKAAAPGGVVVVDYEVVHGGYKLPYDVIWFELPASDVRKVVVKGGKTEKRRLHADGREEIGITIELT